MNDELPTWLKISLLICAMALICGLLLTHQTIPESGTHSGFITETGYRGVIWKTHYVKLVDSHFSTGEKGYQSYWYYGVNEQNLSLFNKAVELQNAGKEVRIKYQCDLIIPIWEKSEGCYITGVD